MRSPGAGSRTPGLLTRVGRVGACALVLTGCALRPPPRLPSGADLPGSARVGGHRLPYVATVPWADAVRAGPEARAITVQADGDAIGHGVCGLPHERVVVAETASAVTVVVAGYARTPLLGQACADVGHGLQPHTVHLRAPLGARRLLDAHDGAWHHVLDVTAVPVLTVPAGFQPSPVTWTERNGMVSRSWVDASTGQPAEITLVRAPVGLLEAHRGPSGTKAAAGLDVAGRPADAWDGPVQGGRVVTLRWREGNENVVQLSVATPTERDIGVDAAIAIARSVR